MYRLCGNLKIFVFTRIIFGNFQYSEAHVRNMHNVSGLGRILAFRQHVSILLASVFMSHLPYTLSGIESRWGRDFPPVQNGPGVHASTCKMSTGSFPVVKCGRGVLLTTHPLLVPRSWYSRAIPLPTLWATQGL